MEHDRETLNYYWDFEQLSDVKEDNFPNTDWNQVRIQAAIAAMRALRSNTGYNPFSDVEIAKYSVNYANALIKELKKEQE